MEKKNIQELKDKATLLEIKLFKVYSMLIKKGVYTKKEIKEQIDLMLLDI